MNARVIMFQGTCSDAGKSLIVAGLARALSNRGLRVRPFKPLNMSNNAAVTADGGEIGRAQALQARAARAAPCVHMNPVLLKPQGAGSAQIIVQGQMRGTTGAADYRSLKGGLMEAVMDSYHRLRAEADIVLVEGAGSASEINLRDSDIANMGFARAANAPVILIGDIGRGGVIASIVGTKAVLDPADAAMIQGFIVNRFRGDPALFATGMLEIGRRTGWAPFGLAPHLEEARLLPQEDSLGLASGAGHSASGVRGRNTRGSGRVRIAVPILPHISNFDDIDPLDAEPDVEVIRAWPGSALPGDADLVLLPGAKPVIAAMKALRAAGFDIDIAAHMRRGGHVHGLCEGYQMLGRTIADPHGIEGPPETVAGLGLLDVETTLERARTLRAVAGRTFDGAPFSGYEMHAGKTWGPGCARPFARLADGGSDGAVCASGHVTGSYIHGLFADDAQRTAWLRRLGAGGASVSYEARIDDTLDVLAAHLETHLRVDAMLELLAPAS